MSTPPTRPTAHFEVTDPSAAFQKLEDFTRRVLTVPKKQIDKKLPKKSSKTKRPN